MHRAPCELVLSATVSYATAYHGSLGHTDEGVILSSSTAHASLRLLRTCAMSALQLAVCQHMEMRGHLFCQSKCQHRQRVCLNLVKLKRVEPVKDVVAESPTSRKVQCKTRSRSRSQAPLRHSILPASMRQILREHSLHRELNNRCSDRGVRDLVPCTRVVGFPSFALQSPSNASRRGVFHLKLASRHA